MSHGGGRKDMDEAVKRVARDVARAMEEGGRPGVRISVEEALAAHGARQLGDEIALASLIVSAASFAWRVAWDLYADFKKRSKEAEADKELRAAVERAVREELASTPLQDQAMRAALVEATTNAVMTRLAAQK